MRSRSIEIEVGREQRHRDRRLIEVDADRLLHARLIAHHLAGADAADRDLALARSQIRDVEAGDIARDVDDVGRARLFDVLVGHRGNRERHFLQRGSALLRRDDDHFVDFFVGWRGRILRRDGERHTQEQHGRAALFPRLHATTPYDLLCGGPSNKRPSHGRAHLLAQVSTSRAALRSGILWQA